MTKIVLFTGKGGTGKTTIAAATALATASKGKPTIALSTDPAHSLGDSLEMNLGPEPKQVTSNLWAQELDIMYNIQKHWGRVEKWLKALFAWRGMSEMTAEEIAVFPGMDEIANLMWALYYQKNSEEYGHYDVVIMDCAPTAESLRLLTFPEIGRWWMSRLLPVGKRMSPIARRVAPLVTDMPMPDQEVFQDAEDLVSQLEELNSLFTDPEVTRIRQVVTPENMVIKESQRSYAYLSLYDFPIDMVICNKVIPAEAEGKYLREWKESQSGYFKQIEESFAPLPIRKVPMVRPEVFGLQSLQEIGETLYGEEDPAQTYFKGKPITLERENGDLVFVLKVPYFEKEKVSLLKRGDELVVQIANYRRNITLPRVLWDQEPAGAKLDQGFLRIRFKA